MNATITKLQKIAEHSKKDQALAKTISARRYAELIERRALKAIELFRHGASENYAWAYFQTGQHKT